jgi:uncharacterized membrane protein YhaH (DUF805 family)
MTATFWLQLSQPLANLWGISAQSASGIFGLFTIIVFTCVIVIKLKRHDLAVPVFAMLMFLGTMIGIIDWVIFVILMVIAGTLYFKFGHGGNT